MVSVKSRMRMDFGHMNGWERNSSESLWRSVRCTIVVVWHSAHIVLPANAGSMLSESDRALLRSFSFRLKSGITREAFKMLPYAFDGIDPEEPDEVDSRVAFLSAFDPRLYHCCPNSCCCFVGPYADLDTCPHCETPRYTSTGRPRKIFTYIPLIPRLVAMYRNHTTAKKLSYRSKYTQSPPKHSIPIPECERTRTLSGHGLPNTCYCPSEVQDVFDGSQYRAVCDSHVRVNEANQAHRHFSDRIWEEREWDWW